MRWLLLVSPCRLQRRRIVATNCCCYCSVIAGDGEEEDAEFDRKLASCTRQDVFAALLRQCSLDGSIGRARKVHSRLLRTGFNTYLGNLLVETFAKCGSLDEARDVFRRIPCKNIFTWTVLITAIARSGHCDKAFAALREMDCEGEKPNQVTLLGLVVACASAGDLAKGRIVHRRIVSCGYDQQPIVGNALVHMYGKCGSVKQAREVFDTMPSRNVVSFNSMLKAYALAGLHSEAMELFDELCTKTGMLPNAVTFTIALGACAELNWVDRGIAIHREIAQTAFISDAAVATALVSMYGKCGELDLARETFESATCRNAFTWSALIAAFAQHGHGKEAFELYRRMMREGAKPSEVTFLSVLSACSTMGALIEGREVHSRIVSLGFESVMLLNAVLLMYTRCRSLEEAQAVFNSMRSRDLKSWVFMITAYTQQGHPDKALALFKEMNLKPDAVIYASVLTACSNMKSMDEGRAIHNQIVSSGLDSASHVGTALVEFYSNCGELHNAKAAFDKISPRDTPSWNAIIGACVQNDQSEQALELFYKMNLEGLEPTHRTFVAVLEACTDTAAFAAGRRLYNRIVATGFELGVVLGTGIINMFGKSGNLEQARDVFNRMPSRDLVTWTAMIAGYTRNGFTEEARSLYQTMKLEGFEPDEVTYISILSSCAHAGLVDECWKYVVSMTQDCGIAPCEEHYLCVIDLLGRAGRLNEAEELVVGTSKQLGLVGWTGLLGACRTHGDVNRANRIMKQVVNLNPERSSPYLLLAHTFNGTL